MKLNKLFFLLIILNWTGFSQNQLFNSNNSIKLSLSSSPSKIAIVDLNNDSHNDIITTTTNGLAVFLNSGNGKFISPVGSPFPAGNQPADIGLADFNGDQNLDIAIPNHERNEVSILLGDGKGNFKAAPYVSLKIDFNPHAHSVATADLNGDGNIDLTMTNFLGSEIIIEFGDGKGNFSKNPLHIAVPHYPYRNVIITDINKDGNQDIITPANNSNGVTILLGNGKGKFSLTKNSPYRINDYPFFITAADFNDDGYPDILATNFNSGSITVLPGNEKHDFSISELKSFKVGLKPVCIAAGDLNNDGITDVVCANYESSDITILFGNKSSVLDQKTSTINVGTSPYGVAVGDLNGDNEPDVATANYGSNNITILFNTVKN